MFHVVVLGVVFADMSIGHIKYQVPLDRPWQIDTPWKDPHVVLQFAMHCPARFHGSGFIATSADSCV